LGGPEARETLLRVANDDHPYRPCPALHGLARLIDRFPNLLPIKWMRFARADRPVSVRLAAVEILDRCGLRGRAIFRDVRG
jgi:hypothetical protein